MYICTAGFVLSTRDSGAGGVKIKLQAVVNFPGPSPATSMSITIGSHYNFNVGQSWTKLKSTYI